MKPYNKFFLLSCFYQEQAAVYEHFGVDDKFFVANNFLTHKFDRHRRKLSCRFRSLLSEKKLEKLTGIKKNEIISTNNIINDIIKFIDKDCPVIVFLNSFAMPQKDDAYQQKHISHAILVYGYDIEKEVFYNIDYKYNNNYTYENKTIPFQDVEDAYVSFEKHLRRGKKKNSLFAFEKVGKPVEFETLVFQKQYFRFMPKVQRSYNDAKEYLDYLCEILMCPDKLNKDAMKVKENFMLLKWDKLGQKHQLKYIFGDSTLPDAINRIHDHYTFILSVMTKYCFTWRYNQCSMEQCILRVKEVILLELYILNELREKAASI